MRTVTQSDGLLVRAPRAARILDISERSLHRLVARGDIEVVRLADRIVRYRVADLEAIIAPHPRPTGPERHRQPAARADRNGARPHRGDSGWRGR